QSRALQPRCAQCARSAHDDAEWKAQQKPGRQTKHDTDQHVTAHEQLTPRKGLRCTAITPERLQVRDAKLATLRFETWRRLRTADAAVRQPSGAVVPLQLGCPLQALPVQTYRQHERLDDQAAPCLASTDIAASHGLLSC